jgi:hypothetical protein
LTKAISSSFAVWIISASRGLRSTIERAALKTGGPAEVRGDTNGVPALAGPYEGVEVGSEQAGVKSDKRGHRRLPAAPAKRPKLEPRPLVDGGQEVALLRPQLEGQESIVVTRFEQADAG